MVSPRILKMGIKQSILKVLEREGIAKRPVLISSLKLETGFTERVIAEIIDDMVSVGLLSAAGDELTITAAGRVVGGFK